MIKDLFLCMLIVGAVLSRLLPHPPNFTPITAIALFAGMYFDRKYAVILPLIILAMSDYVIGFYSGWYWVYGSFMLIGLLSIWLRGNFGPTQVMLTSTTGSIIFYLVTNFGVWLTSGMYPMTEVGLFECYVAAIPFFRNTFLGDLVYTVLLFGTYEAFEAFMSRMGYSTTRTVA